MIGVLTGDAGSIGGFARRAAVLAAGVLLLALAPAGALAAEPAAHQYSSNLEELSPGGTGGGTDGGTGGGIGGGTGGGTGTATDTGSGSVTGDLPFTGLDVAVLAAVAAALLAAGLLLHRRRTPEVQR